MPDLITPAERDELMRHAMEGDLGAAAIDTMWDAAAGGGFVRSALHD